MKPVPGEIRDPVQRVSQFRDRGEELFSAAHKTTQTMKVSFPRADRGQFCERFQEKMPAGVIVIHPADEIFYSRSLACGDAVMLEGERELFNLIRFASIDTSSIPGNSRCPGASRVSA